MKLIVKPFLILSLILKTVTLLSQSPPPYINKIYNDLFYSISNGDLSKPKLLVYNDINIEKKLVSIYSPSKGTITIGQSFIDLTSRFGKDSNNARAHVFSHELAHLFLNHGYTSIIGTGFASKEISEKFKKEKSILEDSLGEYEADQWAFFYSYIAGYQTNQIVPRLLDSIYSFYNLKDAQLTSYPTLKERKNYANQANEKMKLMCESFDFANIALMHGDYNFAAGIFELIRDEGFKSREIFSNLGLAHLLRAIELADEGEIDFKLPLQIDLNTRLRQEATRSLEDDAAFDALNKAIENFQKAIRVDENYFYGYMNLAIAYWLIQDYTNYEFFLIKAKKLCPSNKIQDLIILESIVKCKSKEDSIKQLGLSALDSLANAGNKLAEINSKLLRGEKNNRNAIPLIIDSLKKINLTLTTLNSVNFIKDAFKRDVYNNLTCDQVDGKILYRKWRYSKGDYPIIVLQYFLKNGLIKLDEKTERELLNSASAHLKGPNFYFLLFDNILLKIYENKTCEVQVIKSS